MSPSAGPAPAAPDERGTHAGRPFWLWRSAARGPSPAMIILHGAGSAKENHADFARVCAAHGWVALSYDQRGHGESAEDLEPAALGDVARMAAMLAERDDVDAARICVRGSSMGGFWAIHAAATSAAIAGAIAICPAGESHLLRGLRSGDLDVRAGPQARASLEAWLGEHDLRQAVELMGRKPLILLHARGDERIPSEFSEELAARKSDPKRLILMPGGHHRSIQHDPELQATALAWLAKRV